MILQTQKISNVRLINSQNTEYKAYCRRKNLEKRINSTAKIKDSTLDVSRWLELTLVTELQKNLTIHADNILQWQAMDATNLIRRKYKELDGVFNLTTDSIVQLNDSKLILKHRFKRITSVLVAADCRNLHDSFGKSEEPIITSLAAEHDYSILDNLTLLSTTIVQTNSNYLCLLDLEVVTHLTDVYGAPELDLIN